MVSVKNVARAAVVVAVMLLAAGAVQAVVIDTVPVGNPGNAGELSGAGAGGYGPDRICGAVGYTYNIGKYEVTAGQYTAFLTAVAATDTYGLYNTNMSSTSLGSGITQSGGGTVGNPYTYSVDANFVNRPVNFVSWGDAARFANWLTNGQGNGSTETGAYSLNGAVSNADLLAVVVPSAAQRATWSNGAKPYFLLTSEDEWYKAAYHDKTAGLAATYFDYPTSSDTVPGRDMADPLPGNNANFLGWPYPIDSGKYTTVAGEFENSDSPYGTFDQGGNVWEWNEAIIGFYYRVVRGGPFNGQDGYMLAAYRYDGFYMGFDTTPTSELYNIGFRVSEVPEPATLALLAVGGLLALRRRR